MTKIEVNPQTSPLAPPTFPRLTHAVEQEIYAKALMHNIAQALCSEAAQQLEVEKRELAGQPCVCSKENVGAVVVKKTARLKVKALASSKTEMYQFKT